MKLKTAISLLSSTRCCHRTPSGRQCRFLASHLGSGLCPHHHTEFLEQQNADLSPELLNDSQGFQTAQGINHSLYNLYWLLASNRISPRRAAILAYINSLQLRTLPAIDADWKLGITDPTASPESAHPPANHSSAYAPDNAATYAPANHSTPEPRDTPTVSPVEASNPLETISDFSRSSRD